MFMFSLKTHLLSESTFKLICCCCLITMNHEKTFYVLLADCADEASRVVGLAQGSDYFPLHKVPTAIAAGAVHALVVQCAQIVSILHEEAPLGKVTATHCRTHTVALSK